VKIERNLSAECRAFKPNIQDDGMAVDMLLHDAGAAHGMVVGAGLLSKTCTLAAFCLKTGKSRGSSWAPMRAHDVRHPCLLICSRLTKATGRAEGWANQQQ
jgi:hypothetical protein